MKSASVFLCFATSIAFASVETQSFDTKHLEALKIENLSGNVTIGVSNDNKAHISINKIKFEDHCTLEINQLDKHLVIAADKGKEKGSSIWSLFSWMNDDDCKIHFNIQIQKTTALDVTNGMGNLIVNDITGEINFSSGVGTVNINTNSDIIHGKVGVGDIEISGVVKNANLKIGVGDVRMRYKSAIEKGEIGIDIGVGSAELFFPSNMKILTDLSTGVGQIHNDLGNSSNASFQVMIETGVGDLYIKRL